MVLRLTARIAPVIVALFVSVSSMRAAEPEVEVATLDGRTIAGQLKAIANDGVVITAAGEEKTVKSAELHSLAPKEPAEPSGEKPAAWVELVDGSRLPASSYLSKNGKSTIKLGDGAELTVAIKQVRSVRYFKLDDPEAEVSAAEAAGDLLGVRKRDSVDFLEGVIGDVTAEAIAFSIDGQTIPVNPSKVDSLVYSGRATDESATPVCVLEEVTGAVFKAKSVTLADEKLQLTLLAGAKIERPFALARRLDFSAGKLVYLGDLKPESVNWTSFFDLGKQSPALAKFLGPRFDRGREDDVMRLAGKTYKRGVSLTSRTEIVYKVPGQAKRFRALAGIDDTVGNLGSVQLEITGDGRKLYSGKLAGKDEPVELDLDLAGVRRLTILVDFGDDLDVADHLNLCEARIVK
jgi:hypothetical protein